MKPVELEGKIAVITGASQGIGRATAIELARHGVKQVLGARNQENLAKTAQSVRELGGEALVVQTDVTVQEQVQSLVDSALERWGSVDILVTNAGQYIHRLAVELDAAVIERSMGVNFYGQLYAVLAVMPHMLAQGSGSIVLVSTLDSRVCLPTDGPYVAAKSALTGLGSVLRQELKPHGIHVCIMLPGRVETAFIDNLKVPAISGVVPPDAVARAIVKGIQRRKAEIILPTRVRLMYYASVIHPVLGDWVVRTFHLQGWLSD